MESKASKASKASNGLGGLKGQKAPPSRHFPRARPNDSDHYHEARQPSLFSSCASTYER
jgi:hypothetical protein